VILFVMLVLTGLHPDALRLTPKAIQVGAAVLAAEARGAPSDLVPIAAVVGNRVQDPRYRRGDNPWLGVLQAPRQFARPAPPRLVRLRHYVSFVAGAILRPGWTRRALLFATEPALSRGGRRRRWSRRYPEIPTTRTVHVFFGY
jgi:hypothetical protein